MKTVPQLTAKAPKKDAPKTKVDRLFVRIVSNHSWRKLSPVCSRGEVEDEQGEFMEDTSSFKRVTTGFAILEKNEIIRQRLLYAAPKLVDVNAKLEEASNLVVFQIVNIRTIINRLNGIRTLDV